MISSGGMSPRFARQRPTWDVFAVEPHAAQLSWTRLNPDADGVLLSDEGGSTTHIPIDARVGSSPGAIEIGKLRPSTTYAVQQSGPTGDEASPEIVFRTLDRPAGEELYRFASISDTHIACERFGALRTLSERPRRSEPPTMRCADAAIAEAVGWGAQAVLVKGDVTEKSTRSEWEHAFEVLRRHDVEYHLMPGNHDVHPFGDISPAKAAAEGGFHLTEQMDHLDRPGVRIICLDTTISKRGKGRLPVSPDAIADTAKQAPGLCVVAMHHHIQPTKVPRSWPVGIDRDEGALLVNTLRTLDRPILITSGHAHRHRLEAYGPITASVVGSTKDWPGVWAGYIVYESGLVQVVRRVARPDAIAWTDYTARALAGIWGLVSAGHRYDRCFTIS